MITIGLSGFIGSGKNTVANILKEKYNFEMFSYADSLKDAVSSIFGWPRNLLEGDTLESREFRDTIDFWWSKRLNKPLFTPRIALQEIGTNTLRDHFNQDIWIASLERKISQCGKNAVITDCRFENEIKNILKNNGLFVQILRETPDWLELGIGASRGCRDCIDQLNVLKIHSSEWAWLKYKPHYVINNNGSLDDLNLNIDKFCKIYL